MSFNKITDQDLILVTGASGFIATHIVKQLLEKGYRVRGTVRSVRDEKKVAPLRRLAQNSRYELELVEADLMKEDGWSNAVKGCTYVMHTASPYPTNLPKNEDEIVRPAVNGTLFVFRACVEPGSIVKRVILTSSIAAVAGDSFEKGHTYTERDWPRPDGLSAYLKSKTLAEKAAWDFVREREQKGLPCFELAVINPGMVLGPYLHNADNTSMEVIKRMMLGEMPVVPNVRMATCDVRDVAKAHVNALTAPGAKNNRHLISSTKDSSSFIDWANILDQEFRDKNYKISKTRAPDFLIRVASCFDKPLAQLVPMLSAECKFDNSRMINELGIQPTSIHSTIVDSAYSLIEKGIVPKKF